MSYTEESKRAPFSLVVRQEPLRARLLNNFCEGEASWLWAQSQQSEVGAELPLFGQTQGVLPRSISPHRNTVL